MKLKLKVISYLPLPNDFHMCEDESGQLRRVDLLMDRPLSGFSDPLALVGKRIECEGTFPYLEIAQSVIVIEQKD